MNNGIFSLALLFHYFFYNTEELVNYNDGCEPVFWIGLTFSRIWIRPEQKYWSGSTSKSFLLQNSCFVFFLCFGWLFESCNSWLKFEVFSYSSYNNSVFFQTSVIVLDIKWLKKLLKEGKTAILNEQSSFYSTVKWVQHRNL